MGSGLQLLLLLPCCCSCCLDDSNKLSIFQHEARIMHTAAQTLCLSVM